VAFWRIRTFAAKEKFDYDPQGAVFMGLIGCVLITAGLVAGKAAKSGE
jgi:uncharacterized OsmC-like protein